MMRGAQTQHLLPGSGNKSKMPSDKPSQQYNNNNSPLASRPLMPALSASAKVGRPPLTPRIAGSATSTRSPVLRRGTGAPTAETTPKSTAKDGIATPVKAFLSSNITPRSSSRKARADSAGNTPNGTPNETPSNSRPTSTLDATSLIGDSGLGADTGLGIGGLEDGDATKFVIADGSTKPSQSPLGSNWPSFSDERSKRGASSDAGAADPSPMFFFASDVKSSPAAAKLPPQRPGLPKKTSSFFYANDQSALGQTGALGVQSPSSASDSSQGKFFQLRTASVPKVNTAVSGSFRAHSPAAAPKRVAMAPRQATLPPTNPSWQSQQHRPPSPSRDYQPSENPTLKDSPAPRSPRSIRPMPQPMAVARSPSASSTASRTPMNRGSAASPSKAPAPVTSPHRQVSHKRSISMASLEASPPTTAPPPPLSGLSSFNTPSEEPQADASSPPTTYALASPSAMFATTATAPTSPTKSSQADSAATSAAHQARRERKVLDLEISNSSLLAINRTLEREMRKQNAELRRFRRLSRAGRLSLASHARHSTLTATTDNLSDISGVSGLSSEEDEDDYLSSTSSSPSSLSPGANDARRMLKDETRLKLDLQKHQQLLVDSQKMNQSLKRCLGWTEALIQDGRKAMEYTVRVSEVEVGGRVLGPEDEDEGLDAENPVHTDTAAQPCLNPPTDEEQRVAHDDEVSS